MTARRRWYKGLKGPVSRWIIDVDYRHPDGTRERVRRTSPIQTRRGAEQHDRDIRQALAAKATNQIQRVAEVPQTFAAPETKSETSFAAFSEEFLDKYARANNKPSELDSKRRIFQRHLLPYFDDALLSGVSLRSIENYKALKTEQGLSAKTINNHLAVLGRMLRVAEAWEVIPGGPKIKLLRVAQHERGFLSFDQAQTLVKEADAGMWRTMITLAVRTGLRLGELRALAVKDIDLERHQIHVRRAAWKDIVGTPKGGRHRIVDLSQQAEKALRDMPLPEDGFVFVATGRTMLTKEACKWPLWRACDRAKLGKRIGWHALRHTFASHLVARGAPLKAVQELLGHTDIKMTMCYAHLAPHDRSRAVHLLDD